MRFPPRLLTWTHTVKSTATSRSIPVGLSYAAGPSEHLTRVCKSQRAQKNKTEKKTINYDGVWRMNLEVPQPENRSCSVVWWYDSRYFCITCQAEAGWTRCCWVGYCHFVSFGLDAGASPHQCHLCSVQVPMMFWTVLITCCRALLSWAVRKPCQFVMFPVRMLSIAPL